MSKSKTENKKRGGLSILLELLLLAALVVGTGFLLREGYHRYMKAAYPLQYDGAGRAAFLQEYGIDAVPGVRRHPHRERL